MERLTRLHLIGKIQISVIDAYADRARAKELLSGAGITIADVLFVITQNFIRSDAGYLLYEQEHQTKVLALVSMWRFHKDDLDKQSNDTVALVVSML